MAMPLLYPTIGLTARTEMAERNDTLCSIIDIVSAMGGSILMDSKRPLIKEGVSIGSYESTDELDALIVVGGDGTILRAVREMGVTSVPIISINRGTVGFLSEIPAQKIASHLPLLLTGSGMADERRLLHISAKRGSETLAEGNVLNEAVISQGAISRLIDLDTSVNGEPLTVFNADGIILATPTGSTAYSLSAGGPIVHPQLAATILTPINPHSFSQKPIVLPGELSIEVTVKTKENKFRDTQVSLTLDGQSYVTLKNGDTVQARLSSECIRFLRCSEDTFFETLRTKLKWGE